MIDIRPATDADIPQARLCISKGCAEPNWKFCHVVVQDGEIVGFIEIETVLTGDVHMKKGANGASLLAFGWFDGKMRAISSQWGFGGYEFFVANEQPKEWHEFIKRYFPVGEGIEKPGKFYYRSFENGQERKSKASGS